MRRSSAKKSSTKKKVAGTVTRRRQQYTKKSVPKLISGSAPIQFRRPYYDAIFIFDDSDTLQVKDGLGADITWLFVGTPSADAGIASKQFGFAVNPGIDDLVNSQDLRNLFAQYKFGPTEFEITFEQGDSAFTQATASSGAQSPGPPHIYYYYDSSSDFPPNDVTYVMQKGNLRSHLLTNNHPLKFSHTLRPNMAVEIGDKTVAPFAVLDHNPWMITNTEGSDPANLAPHFGTHFYVRNFGGSFTGCRMRVTAIQQLYLRYPR